MSTARKRGAAPAVLTTPRYVGAELEGMPLPALIAEARRLGVSDAETPKSGEEGTATVEDLRAVIRRARGEDKPAKSDK